MIHKYNSGKDSYDEEEYEEYIIKRGDTLSKIARDSTGDSRNYTELARLNNIQNANRIKEGDVIRIPKRMRKELSATMGGENGIMPMINQDDQIIPQHRDMEPLTKEKTGELQTNIADKSASKNKSRSNDAPRVTKNQTRNSRRKSTLLKQPTDVKKSKIKTDDKIYDIGELPEVTISAKRNDNKNNSSNQNKAEETKYYARYGKRMTKSEYEAAERKLNEWLQSRNKKSDTVQKKPTYNKLLKNLTNTRRAASRPGIVNSWLFGW